MFHVINPADPAATHQKVYGLDLDVTRDEAGTITHIAAYPARKAPAGGDAGDLEFDYYSESLTFPENPTSATGEDSDEWRAFTRDTWHSLPEDTKEALAPFVSLHHPSQWQSTETEMIPHPLDEEGTGTDATYFAWCNACEWQGMKTPSAVEADAEADSHKCRFATTR